MSSYNVYQAFHDRLTGSWTQTLLCFENENIEAPYDANGAPLPFVYVEIYGDDLYQETVGAPGDNQWLEQGVTYIHVMVPSFTGTAAARQSADEIANLFRESPLATDAGNIHIPEMSIGGGEPGKDFPNFWALTITMHWHVRTITGS